MTIYLKNVTYIDYITHEITKGHLKVNDGIDGTIEFVNQVPNDAIDCFDKIVTKSFVCGHHHVYSALSRGMPSPKVSPQNFLEILKYVWWNLDRKLDLEMIEASALVTALYCAKNGITFVIDHHSSPSFIKGSLKTIAKAFDKIGLSHLLCYELSDRDGDESKNQGLEETEEYLSSNNQGLVGLHASFTVGRDLLEKSISLVNKYNSGLHIHVAEDLSDQSLSLENFGWRVVERLEKAGGLESSKTILSHCIHINNKERDILANSNVYIVQNVESNLNNQVGLFSSKRLKEENIMLGTDGMHSDMIRSLQATYFQNKGIDNLDLDGAYKRLRNAHKYLKENNFKGDSDNNLVILDYDSPTNVNSENWLSHVLYGLSSSNVNSVISSGKLIVKDKKLLTANEDEILLYSKEQAERLWKKLKEWYYVI